MQTTFQDNAQDDSGCRRVDSSSDDCATPTKHDARKSVAAASGWDFTVTEWSRPFTPRCARGTTHNEWPGHNNASNTGWSAARHNRDYDSDKRDDGKTLDRVSATRTRLRRVAMAVPGDIAVIGGTL